jgi:hypothetical protein
MTKQPKQGVCHIVALPFTLTKYLKGKRRIMKTQIFHYAKNKIFKKTSKEKPKSFNIIIITL